MSGNLPCAWCKSAVRLVKSGVKVVVYSTLWKERAGSANQNGRTQNAAKSYRDISRGCSASASAAPIKHSSDI